MSKRTVTLSLSITTILSVWHRIHRVKGHHSSFLLVSRMYLTPHFFYKVRPCQCSQHDLSRMVLSLNASLMFIFKECYPSRSSPGKSMAWRPLARLYCMWSQLPFWEGCSPQASHWWTRWTSSFCQNNQHWTQSPACIVKSSGTARQSKFCIQRSIRSTMHAPV